MSGPIPAIASQVRWEQKSYWRNPAAAAFTFAFPLMFLVIFMALNGNGTVGWEHREVRFAQYYLPAILAFGLISACYTNLAFTICTRRERGLLKRTRGTPLSPVVYLCGIVGNAIVVALILTGLLIVLGVTAYDVTFPGRYGGLVVNIVGGAFCFSALGITVATFIPNEDAAPAIINFILFPLLFISGTFGPVSSTSVLGRIAVVFPVRHLVQAMLAVFDPFTTGSGIVASHTLMLFGWGVLGVLVSLRRFRWEPTVKA